MAKIKTAIKLQIQKKYLDEILAGIKKVDYRDETDYYIDLLCKTNKDGEFIDWQPIETVTFVNGYKKGRKEATYKVDHIAYEEWVDDKDKGTGVFTFAIYLGERVS